MERIEQSLLKLAEWEYTPLCLLTLVILVLRFVIFAQLNDLVFDENYYVPAARSIVQGTGTDITQHPPLAQLLIASGILLFGDNPLGWRFFSVVFGVFSIVLFYLICRQLKMSKDTSYLATFLFSIENLSFVQSSIAMLDVHCLTFILVSFWCYLKGWYVKSGLSIALAALAKLTGALALLVILLHWLITGANNKRKILILASVSAVSFLLLMPLFDFTIWHKWLNPVDQIGYILAFAKDATFANYAQSQLGTLPSRPLEWLINFESMQFLSWDNVTQKWSALYQLMISPPVWAFIIPSVLFLSYKALKRSDVALFTICWFAGTYIFWIPVSLVTDRITYIYYFYPAVGSICIGISLLISQINNTKLKYSKLRDVLRLTTPVYLLVSLVFFIVYIRLMLG